MEHSALNAEIPTFSSFPFVLASGLHSQPPRLHTRRAWFIDYGSCQVVMWLHKNDSHDRPDGATVARQIPVWCLLKVRRSNRLRVIFFFCSKSTFMHLTRKLRFFVTEAQMAFFLVKLLDAAIRQHFMAVMKSGRRARRCAGLSAYALRLLICNCMYSTSWNPYLYLWFFL